MPGPRARGLPVSPSRDRRQGVRHALLHTLPGRAIVIGLVARLVVYGLSLLIAPAPAFLRVIDTAAGVALAVGAAYFIVRLIVAAQRRLLWRVRRKLMISYIFIGLFPALLIVAFFLLCGYLLFYNFSAYLVQSQLHALADQARFLAESSALEIQRGSGRDIPEVIARRQANAAAEFAGVSIAVVRLNRACADTASPGLPAAAVGAASVAGPWSHAEPPATLPAWIECPGFAGVLAYSTLRPATQADAAAGTRAEDPPVTHVLVRAVAFPDSPRPGYAVIVDLPVNEPLTQKVRRETGVELKDVSALPDTAHGVKPIAGRVSAARTGPPGPSAGGGLLNDLVSLFEYRDWASGESGTLKVSMQLRVGELYDRISSAGFAGRNVGQGLLLGIFVVGGLFLVIEFVALIAGLALARSITGSVHQLFTGTERVRQGDFTHKIAVTTDDQLGELAVSFNSMTASIEDLLRQAAEKKRLEEELRIAREIQMSLLPQGPLEMRGLSVTALCVPAREVGGDYYDFFRIGERRLGILIADVSGKGTSAALYMAELKGLMLSLSQIHTSPRALMLAADRIIAANLDARSFITMTYAVLDLEAGTMTYARAGHTPLMYVPGPGSPLDPHVRILAPDGLVLGLNIDNGEMFERLLEEHTLELHPGDLALFFTDGISEAMNEADDFFGEGRLGRLIEKHAHLSSDELRERVLREIQAFVGNAPQHDDMTMIFLKVVEVGAPAAIGAGAGALADY
jgi:sigma-B regulation protein RsbU (phosphoserine phosphatase)